MISKAKIDFEEALASNLEAYTAFPEVSGNLFQLNREVAIARYALTQQAEFYFKSMELLQGCLQDIANKPTDDKTFASVMQLISTVELKSASLIDATHKVASLLGHIINIDVEKANLRCMILNLPTLIKETLNTVSGDPELADKIAAGLDSKINQLMLSFRFAESDAGISNNPNNATPQGIVLQQYVDMQNSVPTQPQSVTVTQS